MIRELKFDDIIKSVKVSSPNVSVAYVGDKQSEINNDGTITVEVKQHQFYLKHDYKTIDYNKLLKQHIDNIIKKTKKDTIYFENDFVEDTFNEYLRYMVNFLMRKSTLYDDVLVVIDVKFLKFVMAQNQNLFQALQIFTYPNLGNNVLFFSDNKEENYTGYKLFHDNQLYSIEEIQKNSVGVLYFTTLREEREKKLERILKNKKND